MNELCQTKSLEMAAWENLTKSYTDKGKGYREMHKMNIVFIARPKGGLFR